MLKAVHWALGGTRFEDLYCALLAGAVGEVSLTWKNSTLSCSKPDGTWGAALSSDSSSSGGTPAWVWAVVGTVAALAAAAVAGGLLWRRRRKRIKQQQEQKLEVLDMEGGQSSDKLSGQASLASAKLSSMGKAQSLQPELSLTGSGDRKLCLATGGSSMMDQLTSSRSGVPEGAWKSRWVGMVESVQLDLCDVRCRSVVALDWMLLHKSDCVSACFCCLQGGIH
jgi:hypothetical protein